MVLILLRIRANIPTIMMGETGCGKTSLIRKLSELMNNGESNMKILNIHAGIKEKEIVSFLWIEKIKIALDFRIRTKFMVFRFNPEETYLMN